jgi:ribonuclease D
MTTLYAEVDKTKIADLPQVLFKGRIVVVETAESARKAVEFLSKEKILGLDSETKPSFRKGIIYKVALLQISTHDTCFLFRLNRMGIPDCLKTLLEDDKQLKIGLSLQDDLHALHERIAFKEGRFVDLQDYVRRFGIVDKSLQKLYANIFRQRISKGQRLSNWEAPVLTVAQQRYAATDAWACIMIYERLEKLFETQNFVFVPMIDEDILMEKTMNEMLNEQRKVIPIA